MFEVEGKIYEIKYNMKTIEKIENIISDSVLSRLSVYDTLKVSQILIENSPRGNI